MRGDGVGAAWAERRLDCQARRWRRARSRNQRLGKSGDQPETEAELTALRRSVARGVPFGAESWQRQTAKRLGLESSLRPVGRPSKAEKVPEKQ